MLYFQRNFKKKLSFLSRRNGSLQERRGSLQENVEPRKI